MKRHGTLVLVGAAVVLALSSGWAMAQGHRGRSRGGHGGPGGGFMRGPGGGGDMGEMFKNLSDEQRKKIAEIRKGAMEKMRSAKSREDRKRIMRGTFEMIHNVAAYKEKSPGGERKRSSRRGRGDGDRDKGRGRHGRAGGDRSRPEPSRSSARPTRKAPSSGTCPHCGCSGPAAQAKPSGSMPGASSFRR